MDVYQRRRLVALSAIAVAFILFVLLIKSCGGSDEETPATPVAGATGLGGATVLAQSDFIAQADPICLEANTALAAVDQSDIAQAATDKSDIVAGELQQLQTLPPPDDGTDKLDKFLKALEKQSAAYQDEATAAERGDDAAVTEIAATVDEAGADAADAADAFGFKVCGDISKVGEPDTGGGGSQSSSTSDTGGTATPSTPVTPAPTTTPVTPVTPAPTEGGGAAPAPTPTPTPDTGTGGSGGVSP